jgi:DNA-binding XRE family transcriptional regulator
MTIPLAPPVAETDADELRRIRATLGLTRTALADVLGLSRWTLAQYEHGRAPVKPATLLLARFLALAARQHPGPSALPWLPPALDLAQCAPPPVPPPSPESKGITLAPGSTCGWKSERCQPPWWRFRATVDRTHHLEGEACTHHVRVLYDLLIETLQEYAARKRPPGRPRKVYPDPPTRGRPKKVRPYGMG